MKFYVMWSGAQLPGEETRRLQGGAWGGLKAGTFLRGARLTQSPKLPIEIETFEEDSGDMPPVFVVPALVVRKDVVNALQSLGVDNIDYYEAEIIDRKRGDTWRDYAVGNVVGLADVVDMGKSVLSPLSPPSGAGLLFQKMVIDESKAQGMKLFRLAAKPSRILVSEQVRDGLERERFHYLRFVPPEEFA